MFSLLRYTIAYNCRKFIFKSVNLYNVKQVDLKVDGDSAPIFSKPGIVRIISILLVADL